MSACLRHGQGGARVLRTYGTCQTAYTFNAFDVTLHRQPATSANEWI